MDDRRRLPKIIEQLSEFSQVDVEHGMAIVCVVGEGLQTDPSLVGQVLQAAGDVAIRMVSQAASSRNVTFVIREQDLPQALGRLHTTFFAPEPAPAGLV